MNDSRIQFRLDNGLEAVLLPNRQAPIVTSVLVYRAGGRDEDAGASGAAHFLEHMMFKGSARYGAGEVDRRTQALGGMNNAFTSHDLTAYYFAFASDRWREALAIERDRMTALTLDPSEIESERTVILEELGMYRDEPWDALELAVQAELFHGHRYSVPVLGEEADLRAMNRERLAAFHRRFYRPGNATLVLAGDLGSTDAARGAIEEAFGDLPAGAGERPVLAKPAGVSGERRVEKRIERSRGGSAVGDESSNDEPTDGEGEIARLLLSFAVPPLEHPDHAALRMLATVLGGGRASRLHRELVDVGQICLSADCGVGEMEASSTFSCSLELLPGIAPEVAERRLDEELAKVREFSIPNSELARARRVVEADWVFQHERIHQQAIVAALAAAQGDLDLPRRVVERAIACEPDELREVAGRYLDPAVASVRGISRSAD